jgi:hypothetical protein
MDTKNDGQPADSYQQRNDLATRSAASDPSAEPRSNPLQSPKNAHARQSSISRLAAAKVQPRGESSKSNNFKENFLISKASPAKQSMDGPLPDFLIKRNELFDKLKRERQAEILEKEKPEISVVLDLGLDKEGKPRPAMPVAAKAWESTPGSFLRHVDKDVSSDFVIAKVDGKELWDLDRPLENACRVKYIPFSSAEGRNVFWHSSAHVLGEAAECQYNCLLSHGPPVEQGFFYDMAIAEG